MHKRTWTRQYDKIIWSVSKETDKITTRFESFIETVNDYPTYDNGAYFVIDHVKDVQWTVYATEGVRMRDFIDKYEAIEYADLLKGSGD